MRKSLFAVAWALAQLTLSQVSAQSTTQWSCHFTGGWSSAGTISSDGRFLVYTSTDLMSVFPYTGFNHLVLKDTTMPLASPIFIGTSDVNGDDWTAWTPSTTPDAAFILLADVAPRLAVDTNTYPDVYLYERATGTYTLISATPAGVPGNASSTLTGDISADGRWLVFTSAASDLVAGDANGKTDVFLRDRLSGTTELVSVGTGGTQGNADSLAGAVSDDGRFVAFLSRATNFGIPDAAAFNDVFLRDRITGTTTCLSVDANGLVGNAHSGFDPAVLISPGLSMSADGRWVAFQSRASNLVPNDTNGRQDVFVRDTLADVTRRVNVGPGSVQADRLAFAPTISADGRFVAFVSDATNLVSPPTTGLPHAYVRDRAWSTTELVSVTTAGVTEHGATGGASISASGRFVTFDTEPTNLGQTCTTQGGNELFLRDRGATLERPYCAGDGVAIACPCGNSSPIGGNAGCLHSLGLGGTLTVSGAALISADTLVLHGAQMPDSAVLYIQGSVAQAGGSGSVFGDGLRCVGGQVVRLGNAQNVGGASSYPTLGDPQVSVQGQVVSSGSRFYQAWFRNADPTFCTSATFNLTNGREITWRP